MSRTDIYRILDTNGDGTGTKNAIGDYDGLNTKFYIKPPSNQDFALYRMIVYVKDAGTLDASSYGNGITLATGIKVRVADAGGVILDLFDGQTVKSNADWAGACYDVSISTFGTGDNYLHVRWTFAKSGQPLIINGEKGEWLEVVLNDAFDGLLSHYFKVQGKIQGT